MLKLFPVACRYGWHGRKWIETRSHNQDGDRKRAPFLVKNVAESAKILTNVQTFRDCAPHQWNARYELSHASWYLI